MKQFKIILAYAFLFMCFLACKNEPKSETITIESNVETTKKLDPNATYSKAEFNIKGMTCEIPCKHHQDSDLGSRHLFCRKHENRR